MNYPVHEGSLFVRTGTPLPTNLNRTLRTVANGWSAFEGVDENTIDAAIKGADWHLFSMVNPVSGIALHSEMSEAIRSATARALGKVDARYNAAEISHITIFNLGVLIFASVSMHPQHIQENLVMETRPHPLPPPYAAA